MVVNVRSVLLDAVSGLYLYNSIISDTIRKMVAQMATSWLSFPAAQRKEARNLSHMYVQTLD